MNRTYDLDSSLVARINTAAQERGLSKNDLVAYLLAHALDRLDDGALEVPVRPNTFAILREPA